MKKLCATCVVFLVLFSFSALSDTNCFAAELEGVTGASYLTFISHPPYFEILSFGSDGTTFNMVMLEDTVTGTGTFTDHDLLFSAEWVSSDGNLTYSLGGISLAGVVIIGTGEVKETSGTETDTDNIRFFGILSILFPD